jgi:hypothetical protein
MKKAFVTVFVLIVCIYSVNGQALQRTIKGVLLQGNDFKYAYLQATNGELVVTEVVNNRFEFTVPKNGDFDNRILFLQVDSIDRKLFESEKRNIRSRSSRLIALEDLTIEIGSDLPSSVVKGGPDNIEVDEMNQALLKKDFAAFFKLHSDSRISLLLLKSLIRVNEISLDLHFECSTFFDALSLRLRTTPEGEKVRKLLTN